MGLVSKGKHKITVELKPDTISAIDRQVRLFEGTKSRGSVIDDLVSSVLEADFMAAAEVYEFCLKRWIEEKAKIADADPVSANDIKVKSEAFDALRKTFSTALIDDKPDIKPDIKEEDMESKNSKKNKGPDIKAVKLSGDRFELVPSTLVLLNPSLEGKRAHLWGVWAYDVDHPCDLCGAGYGKCLGPLMGYFSDRNDLWKCGQHKPARFIDEADANDCMNQGGELMKLAAELIIETGAAGDKTIVVAWAMFDMMSTELTTPMGTSFAFGPAKRDAGSNK